MLRSSHDSQQQSSEIKPLKDENEGKKGSRKQQKHNGSAMHSVFIVFKCKSERNIYKWSINICGIVGCKGICFPKGL